MSTLFLYGTLCDAELLALVLGHTPEAQEAHLADYDVTWVEGQPFPMIRALAGARARGIVLRGLCEADLDRLNFYEGGFVYTLAEIHVQTDDGPVAAQMYLPDGQWEPGMPWSLADWQAAWGEITKRTTVEVMDRYGKQSAAEVAGLLPFMRNRGWAQMLAKTPAPQTLRRSMSAGDVEMQIAGEGYDGFFRHRPFEIRYRRFDGAMGDTLRRECFVAYDVALVLPYDPVTDQVLLVEQLRFGPIHRGDPAPWVLEAVAGMVDAGETPQEAARREAVEEAGLQVSELLAAPSGYASPGYTTEFYHNFIGLCDLSERAVAEAGGLAEEHEDIRSHVLTFDHAMALVQSGEINAMPLQMLLLALGARRSELRARA